MIIHSTWFTQMGIPNTIGIVWVKDEYGEIKSYIGTGNGKDKMADMIKISDSGSPINIPFLNAEDSNVKKNKIGGK